jgi:adenylate kinase family enzyme
MKRIVIIGSSSSGKTTLGQTLSKRLNIEHQELDFFFWEPNWTQADPESFRQRVDPFTAKETWITDGNFSQVRDLVWGRATSVIWLDYPFHIIIKQFFKRSIIRSFKKEKLWDKNTETLWNSMLRPDSLLMWILKTYKRNKKRYSALMDSKEFPNVKYIRLKNPKETEQFLNKL